MRLKYLRGKSQQNCWTYLFLHPLARDRRKFYVPNAKSPTSSIVPKLSNAPTKIVACWFSALSAKNSYPTNKSQTYSSTAKPQSSKASKAKAENPLTQPWNSMKILKLCSIFPKRKKKNNIFATEFQQVVTVNAVAHWILVVRSGRDTPNAFLVC